MTGTPHQRFVFETVFDAEGDVVVSAAPTPRARRLIPVEEVEDIRALAYAEGQRSTIARAEEDMADALRQVAADIAASITTLAAVAHEHRAGSAKLALAAAGKIAGAALEMFPEAPVVAALESLAREVEAAPRLTVQAPPELVERLQAALDKAADAAGHPGQIVVKPGAGLGPAAFTFDWGDGRAAFDPVSAADRVAAALDTALAAEGLHAEPLLPPEGSHV